MNFNLISPSNNGSDFIVQFRDNIEIKSSSKVYLNFCELTRTNNITLIKDSIITVNYNLIPFYKLVDEVWEENKLTVYYTIPKGSYTIQEFKDLINLRMDLDLITDTDERFYYNFIFGSGNSTSSNIPIGYTVGGLPNDPEIDKKWVDTDLTLDTVNIKDFTYVKGTGYTCQSTNPVIGQYTSYGLADTHYWHYLYNDPAQSELNWIKIKTTSNLKDNVCFGLYSTEFMTLPFNTENPRTNGNDLETLYKTDTTYTSLQDIPQGFVLVELQMTSANETQDEPRLKIWIAGNSNTINNGSMQNNIGQMSLVFTKSLTVWFDSSSSMPMKFRTYNKSISEPDFKSDVFFFQLWTDDLNNTLIYDSADDDIFFEKQFFKMAMNQAQFNQDMNDCGIPFKVFLGACALDDGFLSVNYVEFK